MIVYHVTCNACGAEYTPRSDREGPQNCYECGSSDIDANRETDDRP
jgi:predicted Zn-ribbon and HTH transcriptional regulator